MEGEKTSTLVQAPTPPDRMIPGMEIIIRVLLPVLLTLCSREPGHVLPKAGSTDTSSGQEEEEGRPCNHLLPTSQYSSLRRLGLHILQRLFIQIDKNLLFCTVECFRVKLFDTILQ